MAKVYIFTPVCHSFCSRGGGGGSAPVHAGIPPLEQTPPGADPPGSRHPPRPGRHPPTRADTTPPGPGRHPPGPGRHPPDQADTPWTRQTPPRTRPPSPREADCSIRLTSGRYASYWNAFLFEDKDTTWRPHKFEPPPPGKHHQQGVTCDFVDSFPDLITAGRFSFKGNVG